MWLSHIYISNLYNNAVSNSGYTESNDLTTDNNELKNCGTICLSHSLSHVSAIRLEISLENTKNFECLDISQIPHTSVAASAEYLGEWLHHLNNSEWTRRVFMCWFVFGAPNTNTNVRVVFNTVGLVALLLDTTHTICTFCVTRCQFSDLRLM